MTAPPNTVAYTARILRRAYIVSRLFFEHSRGEMSILNSNGRLHPKWDGGVCERGITHVAVWPRLAAYAVDHAINPVEWVDTLFSLSHLLSHPPFPTDLKWARVLDIVNDPASRSQRRENRLLKMDSQLGLARTEIYHFATGLGWTEREAAEAVVGNVYLDIGPLVRYWLARTFDLPAVADQFRTAAACQWREDPVTYADIVGDESIVRDMNGMTVEIEKSIDKLTGEKRAKKK